MQKKKTISRHLSRPNRRGHRRKIKLQQTISTEKKRPNCTIKNARMLEKKNERRNGFSRRVSIGLSWSTYSRSVYGRKSQIRTAWRKRPRSFIPGDSWAYAARLIDTI